MRTTLDIADDVLLAAKETARRQKTSLGAVISELARRSLVDPRAASPGRAEAPRRSGLTRLGIQPLPRRGGIVSNETINQLRDDGIY
jgi:hypothetical protein